MRCILFSSLFDQNFAFSVNLPKDESYFENYDIEDMMNFYVNVEDSISKRNVSIGTWHLLPQYQSSNDTEEEYNEFDSILGNNSRSIVIYFHGAGEARSYPTGMYHVLRMFFHVVPFDYRSE